MAIAVRKQTTSEGTFAGAGGVAIRWERTDAIGPPRGVVLISHGYAEHLGRYADFVAHLASRGLAVAGIDHRGHGRSGGPRGHCDDVDDFVADLRTLAGLAQEWWPGVPRVLFGHSLGGLLALAYLLRHPETVRAAALSAPALRVPDAPLQWVALTLARLAPGIGFRTKLDARLLARDPAVGAAYVADPLVHRRATAGFVRAVRRAQDDVFAQAGRLAVPLLILQGDADGLVDPAAAAELHARLVCTRELVVLPGYYHELLNEPQADAARVLERIDAWFDRWLAA